MGAFASDVAQLPRIVTLNDLVDRQRQGRAVARRRGQDVPLPRRGRDREAARRGEGQGKGQGQEMNARSHPSCSWAPRCSPAAAARATRTCAPGWPSRARARAASSIRCRRSSRTTRSRTTRSTCPTRSSRARSSRPRAPASSRPTSRAARSRSRRFRSSRCRWSARSRRTRRSLRSCARRNATSTRSAPGNYLGQNYGVVTNIGEGEVKLKELVQDGAGDWTERSSTLQLQSRRKTTGAETMSALQGNSEPRSCVRATRMARRVLRHARRPRRVAVRERRARADRATASTNVTVSRASSGRVVVRFQLKNPPANPPASFSINNPPRIALDFLDTANGLNATQRAVDEAGLRSLNVIQAGNRTRVVFNLNRPQSFDTQVEGNTVVVTLNDQETVKPGTDTVQRFAEAKAGETQHSLRDIDFRRGTQRRGAPRRRPVGQLHRHRHPAAGPDAGRRFPQDVGAAQPRAAHRRRRLRHAGAHRRHVPAGQQRADDHRAEGPVGALGLPDRQPLHPRGEADPRGSEQARAGLARRLQGREAVAQLPERGSARGAAGDRRLHRPQHHHQRHGAGQPHAAAEGHPVGPGARHHPADEGPRHAQERQCRAHRAAGGARAQGEAAARERDPDRRARAAGVRVVPAQLHQGAGHPQPDHQQPAAAVRRRCGADADDRRTGLDHLQARRRDHRPALQHPVRDGYRSDGSRKCARSSGRSTRRSGRC